MDANIDGSPSGASEPSSISSTLLERIRTGQPAAWRRLVDLYGPVVYRWCRQLGVLRADAADVVQEVFGAVAAHVARFRRDRPDDSFGAWLRTITRNKIRDYYRQRQHRFHAEGGTDAYRQVLDLPEPGDDSLISNSRLEPDRQFLHRALEVVRAEFEPQTWDAFWRVVVDGQSPTHVAEATGMSLHAVYQAKSRVLRRLRREWSDSAD